MSLAEKRRSYEASCQSKAVEAKSAPRNAKAKPARENTSAVAKRMREKFGTRERKTDNDIVLKKKLANITEQTVLKKGLRRLHNQIVVTKAVDILQFAKRLDGSSKVMRTSFLERLLSKRIEIKGSLESDVAAAQLDLRHLNVEQLLSLRADTLDFLTESDKFNAHNNFLNTLDQHLFEKIAMRCCELADKASPEIKPQVLFTIGFRIALTLGALDVLADEEAHKSGHTGVESVAVMPLPKCWVIQFEDILCQGSRYAIFNVVDLSFQVVKNADFLTAIPPEEILAVVRDRSSGSGPTRMLYWEVSCLDPRELGDDMASHIDSRTRTFSDKSSRRLSDDLDEALRKMRSRGSSEMASLDETNSLNTSSQSIDIGRDQDAVPLIGGAPVPVPVEESSSSICAVEKEMEEQRRSGSVRPDEVPLIGDTPGSVPVEESSSSKCAVEEEMEEQRRSCSVRPDEGDVLAEAKPVVLDDPTAEVADESEEGVALLAHQRAITLQGNTTEGRSVKTAEFSEAGSKQALVRPRPSSSCLAGCLAFLQRPAKST